MSATAPTPGANRRLLSATWVMASGTLVSRVLGFIRVMLIAFVLGNGTRQADIFSMSQTIPNSLYMLFAGGALNTVLVPQIVRAMVNHSDGGKAYVDRVMTAFLIVLGAMTTLMTVLTPAVMYIYTADSWRVASLAQHYQSLLLLTYISMPQLFFYGAFFLIGQVLNARDKFGPMMWAPILNNVISIGVFVVYIAMWGTRGDRTAAFTTAQVMVLGVGNLIAMILQTAVLIPYMRAAGFRYRPRFDLKGTGLGHIFRLSSWALGYVALTQVASIVVNNLATSATSGGLGAGVTTYLNAQLVWILPHSLITVSLATAMLPSVSRLAAARDMDGVERETTHTVRLASAVAVTTSVLFVILAVPFANLAFGLGHGGKDANFVAWTLMGFAVGLVPYTIQYLYMRGFYAQEDNRTPFYAQVIISGANALLAIAFVLPWNDPATVAPRLALSYSVAYVIGVVVSHRWLKRKLPTLSGWATVQHVARLLIATIPSAAAAWLITWALAGFTSLVMQLVSFALSASVAVVLFFFVAKRMRIAEASHFISVLRRSKGGGDGAGDGSARPDDEPTSDLGSSTPAPDAMSSPPHGLMLDYPEPSDTSSRWTDEFGLARTRTRVSPGQILNERYRLDELLASHDTTLTWRAHDIGLSRPVLIHMLAPDDPRVDLATDIARQACLTTDARFLAVLDATAMQDAQYGSYLVYEYTPGAFLSTVLLAGPLSNLEAAWLTREVAEAVAGLHAQGLHHRELRPDTVLVTTHGNVKILGLFLEAQLHPTPGGPQDGVARDLAGIGHILYAALTARWPDGPAYGLHAAPVAHGRPVPPGQARSGVDRSLDVICERVLTATLGGRFVPLKSATDIVTALNALVGATNASHDLESRLAHVTGTPNTSRDFTRHSNDVIAENEFEALSRAAAESPASTGSPDAITAVRGMALPASGSSAAQVTYPIAVEAMDTEVPFTPVPPPAGKVRPTRLESVRRWRPTKAVAVLGVLVAVGLVWLGWDLASRGSRAAQTATTPLAVVSARDFDPAADGGDGVENPRLASLAIDKNTQTRWTTERYKSGPTFGGAKPGVGLVLDLGSSVNVRAVALQVSGSGTNVEIRVPVVAGTEAPLGSRDQWRVVASMTGATGVVTLNLPSAEQTRFVLVYLTSLPSEGGFYLGGIQEIEVRG